ncbi:trigger factor family protein [Porphyromonas cangingivalis]|uniref:trigger factor family protein n=1 Tax=Porphyromonas cangingivalis TaxID=36874 RepID=UPI000688878A|nr:trigger factor family protein [Porphyromonas cangingivalis]
MNISFVEKNDNFARIELKLTKQDYQEAVEKGLKKIRRNASIPGFRKGAVPAGMVKKMYGDSVKIEEVQNLVSEKLYNFIVEEKLKTIGQTIATPGTETVDIVKAEDMTFTFDQASSLRSQTSSARATTSLTTRLQQASR